MACNAVPSNIAPGTALCAWKKSEMKCHAAGPPGDFLFTAMISCAIIIFVLPLGLMLALLCEEVMYLNPDWNAYCCFYYCQRDFLQFESGTPTGNEDEDVVAVVEQGGNRNDFCFQTPEEEALYVFYNVRGILSEVNTPDTKESLGSDHESLTDTDAENKLKASLYKKILGLDEKKQWTNKDETDSSNHVNRLLKLLEISQAGVDDIISKFEAMERVGLDDDQLDMCLIRAFVAEMFFEDSDAAARALAPQNLNLDMVDPFLWCCSWVVVFAIWFFCLYWALVWGIVNGEEILILWLLEFGTAILQDTVFFIPLIILLKNSGAVVKIENQMRHVCTVLQEIASTRLNEQDEDRKQACDSDFTVSITKTESDFGLGIAQHISTGIYMF